LIDLLGLKGCNLCEITRLHLPIPQGFIITTEGYKEFIKNQFKDLETRGSAAASTLPLRLNADIVHEIASSLSSLSSSTAHDFGISHKTTSLPLLLSLRPSLPISLNLPCERDLGEDRGESFFLESVLNVGINEEVFERMKSISGNPIWAYLTYLSMIMNYGRVVLGLSISKYDKIIFDMLEIRGVSSLKQLQIKDLQEILEKFLEFTLIPSSPYEQLYEIILSLYSTWNSSIGKNYRDIHHIEEETGIAIIIQAMVYGNMNENSGSGIVVSRNPKDGARYMVGEYCSRVTGKELIERKRRDRVGREEEKEGKAYGSGSSGGGSSGSSGGGGGDKNSRGRGGGRERMSTINLKEDSLQEFNEKYPKVYRQLKEICHNLEIHLRDVQVSSFLWIFSVSSFIFTCFALSLSP
jgi:pyruvate,orthophosphate dikinase